MKRREYLKEYRQKNKSKLNEYHKKYYHTKKKKGEKEKEDDEEIKSIDLTVNNDPYINEDKNDESNNKENNDVASARSVHTQSSDSNNDDDNNEKLHYINISYIIEEMKSLKDELEATRSLLENTNLLVEIFNDELVKKHRHIKHLRKEMFTRDNNNENNEDARASNEKQ